MAGKIWVLAEQWRGEVSDVSFELLALGRELADGLGGSLEAILLGHGIKGLAQRLGRADNILCVDNPLLADPTPEAHCQALAALLNERKPTCLLVPLTTAGVDIAGLLPAVARAPLVTNCADLRVTGGRLEAKCLLYGGKMVAAVDASAERTILGVQPGVRPAEAGRTDTTPPVEEVALQLSPPRIRFRTYVEPEAGDVDITQQAVLVAVGRGIGSQDNVPVAEEVAEALGGVICGSRPVIDQGWLPLSRQVGKSGATVKPRLYLAVGISGAPEHVEGMAGADLIIAINTDPNAPIFNVAHYGVVEDALDMLPALAEAVRERKG
jgi:electron transfer flavoprotein alpha subunit